MIRYNHSSINNHPYPSIGLELEISIDFLDSFETNMQFSEFDN